MSTIQTKSEANCGFERYKAAPSLSKFAREVKNQVAVHVQERRMIGSGQESETQPQRQTTSAIYEGTSSIR